MRSRICSRLGFRGVRGVFVFLGRSWDGWVWWVGVRPVGWGLPTVLDIFHKSTDSIE